MYEDAAPDCWCEASANTKMAAVNPRRKRQRLQEAATLSRWWCHLKPEFSTSSYVSTPPQWFTQNVLFSNSARQHGSLCSTPWLGWTVMSSLIAPLTNQETSSTDPPETCFKKDGTCKCLIIITIISTIIIITTIILLLMSVLVCRDWNVVSAEKCRKCLNF